MYVFSRYTASHVNKNRTHHIITHAKVLCSTSISWLLRAVSWCPLWCPPSWYILCTLSVYVSNHIKATKFNKLSSCFVSLFMAVNAIFSFVTKDKKCVPCDEYLILRIYNTMVFPITFIYNLWIAYNAKYCYPFFTMEHEVRV